MLHRRTLDLLNDTISPIGFGTVLFPWGGEYRAFLAVGYSLHPMPAPQFIETNGDAILLLVLVLSFPMAAFG
jgi:hypothetical protein